MKSGWINKRIGEVSEIINGGTPKTSVPEYWGGDINWITPADLGKLKFPLVNETPRKITTAGLEKSSAKIFPPYSVILSTRAPIGHLAINTVPMSTNQGCRGIVPNEELNPWFLYYYLKLNVDLLNSLGTGATFKELSTKSLANINIPVPPLPEQQRIVSILEQAFEAIDRARAIAEQNLKNTRELFESYLQGVFEETQTKYKAEILSDLLELITYGFTNPMPTTTFGPYMVTAKNIKHGIVDYSTARRTSKEAFDKLLTDKSRPKSMDVLLTKDGTLGRLAVVSEANLCINQSVALLRPNSRINSYFLKDLLSSPFYQKLMISQAGGTTIKHIYITRVDKMNLPVPPLDDQLEIVKKIDIIRKKTRSLEKSYQIKLQSLEELKKSILQKAFSGEL